MVYERKSSTNQMDVMGVCCGGITGEWLRADMEMDIGSFRLSANAPVLTE
jgi:hypothetical protein